MGAKSKARGKLIVLEGVDGAGTTTQKDKIVEWLRERGEHVHGTHQPSDGPIGAMVRQILRGRLVASTGEGKASPIDPAAVALLFAADRLDHVKNEILPLLERGFHVVCDRYVVSSLAYQGLDTDLRFVRQINDKALAPDLTIFIDVPADIAMARIEATRVGRDSFEKLAIQRRVAQAYKEILADWRGGRVITVDGTAPIQAVSRDVRQALEALLG